MSKICRYIYLQHKLNIVLWVFIGVIHTLEVILCFYERRGILGTFTINIYVFQYVLPSPATWFSSLECAVLKLNIEITHSKAQHHNSHRIT